MRRPKYLKGFIGDLYSDYVNHLYERYQNQDPDMGARFIASIQEQENERVKHKGQLITKEQRLYEDCKPKLKKAGYSLASPYYVELCGLVFVFVQKVAIKFEKENAIMGVFAPKIINNKEDNYENKHRD